LATIDLRPESGEPARFEAPVRGGRLRLPPDLDLGYYDLTVSVPDRAPEATRLILTPERAHLPEDLRCAGIAISLYGVRSARNWGCGDFRDLRGLIDWAVDETGAGFIALNPLHAIHNRRPYNTSPYLPLSVFYQNLLYLDVEAIEDFEDSAHAQRLWALPSTQAALAALRQSEFVEYESVRAWKLRFLKLAFLTFLREGRHKAEFRAFVEQEGDLLDRFATYCALDEYLHRSNPEIWIWPEWPAPYQDPDSPEVGAFQRKHWRSVLFYKYVQWQIDRQLAGAQAHARRRGMPIGLYHDLALATDRCGADLWAYRQFYVAGCRVGSPPDGFAPKGQDWAFPPPDSERHRENGYRLFTEAIRNNCRHGGALRIDHVMRLFRLYWIPDGGDAMQGAYVRDHAEDLVRILALESLRQNVVVVGEDLGTVEPHVRETLQRFGILSYRLFYFEREPGGGFIPCDRYPGSALVSSTTHDLPTLAGFWIEEDIEARHRAGMLHDDASYRAQRDERAAGKQKMLDVLFRLNLLPGWFPRSAADVPELTGELHNAVVGFLAQTPSQLMLVNQEDLTKEVCQQNLPGTTWQYPNWGRKMKFTLEQLRTEKQAHDFAVMFRNWLARTGRLTTT
ncbi:MAG: 4-alpha-glucanotransferase, partial [Candidatus Solibacter usitatus]|nr:4-alpha-glucanotransferase [Candidatus Solibacter usitatus]